MSLLYGLSYYCDVLVYFGSFGLLGALYASGSMLFLLTLLLFAAASVSYRFRKPADERSRYYPMAIVPIVLYLAESVPERILLIPPCVYLFLYIKNNDTVADYYYAARKFRGILLGLILVAFLTMANQAKTWTKGLVWMFLYFALTIFLLRMLRHDDRTVNSAKFRAMNVLSIGSVCAAGWLLSQPQATAVLKRIGLFLADHIMAPIANILLFIIQWILIGLATLFEKLFGNAVMEMEAMPQLDMGASMQEVMGLDEQARVEASPLARAILIGVGVVLGSVILVLLLRLISRQTTRGRSEDVNEIRETLEEDKGSEPRRARPGRSAQPDNIRAWYRKSLVYLKAHGGKIESNMNTLEIMEKNEEGRDRAVLATLRDIYLPVRYGGKTDVSREEIDAMRSALADLRKHGS